MEFTFKAKLWEYEGKGSWVFVSLPNDHSTDIKQMVSGEPKRGFGSVKVDVTIGSSSWSTSIFPDSKNGVYVMPIKKAVRDSEKISDGDTVELTIKPRLQ